MANATTETKLEPLDFIAPRDAVIERTTPPGASMPWIPVRLRRGNQVEFRASNDWTLRGWEIPEADVPRVHAELVALRDSADLTRESGGVVCTGESFPDRVLRVACAAGYAPTRVEVSEVSGAATLFFARATLARSAHGSVTFGKFRSDAEILEMLRTYAGPDNQPEAVRARRAEAAMAAANPGATVKRNGPGVYVVTHDVRGTVPGVTRPFAFNDAVDVIAARDTRSAPVVGTLQPGDTVRARKATETIRSRPSAVDFEDDKSVLNGACVAAKADLLWATQEGSALLVGIRGTYEKSVIVEDLARRAMPHWSKIEVFYEVESDTRNATATAGSALPPSFYDACHDAAHAEHHSGVPESALAAARRFVEVWQYLSPSASARSRGCWDDIAFAVSRVVLESIRRLHDQLASGGVDCPETRAANVARVKDEARVVSEMQDAVRLVASWAMKRKRCRMCAAVIPEYSSYAEPGGNHCGPCIHRRCHEVAGRERVGATGIAIDRTPGPYEGATAWASPCAEWP